MSLVTGLFFLVLLLNQRWSLPLRLHAYYYCYYKYLLNLIIIARDGNLIQFMFINVPSQQPVGQLQKQHII